MQTIRTLTFSCFFMSLVFAVRAQSYDPQKDPDYNGYKYRPGQGFSVSKHKLPPKPSCIKDVKSTISVSGTFDGKGCLYRYKGNWKGKSYKEICFAPKEIAEGMPPMFNLKPGAKLRNLQIECALDGVHTSKNNTIENVIFRDVEEDAITIDENVTVKNSTFWFCNDKCIQMNRANKANIVNNNFYYVGGTAVLANYGYNITANNNILYNAKYGIRSRTNKSLVKASGNTQEGKGCLLVSQDRAILEDWGGNKAASSTTYKCELNGGRVVKK